MPLTWSLGLSIQFAAQIANGFPNLGILTRPQKMLHYGTRARFEQNSQVSAITPEARVSGTLDLG